MKRRRYFLCGVPKASIFSELLCGPCQAQKISDTTADDNAPGSIDPSENQSAKRYNDCADQRINKKDLLLVCPQVICFRKDQDVRDHVYHQQRNGTRVQQPLGKANMLHVEQDGPQPCRESSSNRNRGRLPERPEERAIKLLVFLACDQHAERRRFCTNPGYSDVHDGICKTQ